MDDIISIDETSVDTHIYNNYGWSDKGQIIDVLQKNKRIRNLVVDPGKINLYTMYGKPIRPTNECCHGVYYNVSEKDICKRCKKNNIRDDGKIIFRYTNGQRLKETERIVYDRRIKKYRNITDLQKIEDELTKHKCTTCIFKNFYDIF